MPILHHSEAALRINANQAVHCWLTFHPSIPILGGLTELKCLFSIIVRKWFQQAEGPWRAFSEYCENTRGMLLTALLIMLPSPQLFHQVSPLTANGHAPPMSLLTLPRALLFRAENIIFKSEEENWGKMGVKCIKMSKKRHRSGSELWYCSGDRKLPWTFHKWPRHC